MLGSFELRRGGLPQRLPRKAQGLLAYLALHQGRQVSRDQLATLLWGNTATEQARQSLRQCLASLRNAFGTQAAGLIVTDMTSVMLEASADVAIDVVRFDEACRSSARDIEPMARASALYRGELLVDLHIPIEPFNEWVSLERQRLSAMRSDLLLRLSRAYGDAGDAPQATETARELTKHDPLREEGHRQLMKLLAASSERSAALKQLQVLTNLLNEQLGISPDAETVALADQIRAGIREVENTQLRSTTKAQNAALPVSTDRTTPSPELLRPALLVGPPLPDKPSIVVLPFTNLSGEPGQDYFVDGLVDDITIALGREKWLFVIASSSAFAFRDRNVDPREVATKLGVKYVLRGSFRKSADRVRVVVLLTDAASGEFIWSDRFEDEARNVFDLTDRLMTHVAAMIAPALRSIEIERAQRKSPARLTAFDLYLQALPRFRTSLADNHAALHLLEKAIALDPTYGAAHAFAARCYQFQKLMGWVRPDDPQLWQGVRLAHRATELGSNDSEALWMAGGALVQIGGEIDLGQALIDRSLQLNPNSASAWTSSCQVRTYIGDCELAIEHFQRSQRLNPLDRLHHVHWNIVGMAYFAAGRYEEADAAADKVLSILPAYPQGLRLKIATSGALGRTDVGRENVQRLLAVHPECDMRWLEDFNGPFLVKVPKLMETYLAAARKGGMPEQARQIVRGNSTLQ